MKYCKKCGVLYSDLLGACPKCGVPLEDANAEPPKESTKKERVRQWIGICIGIPALVGVLYLVIYYLSVLAGH
jgi:uncharacterized membrane protein YvbJ